MKHILTIIFALLTFVFLFYGTAIMRINSGSKFFLVWFAFALFCGFLSLAIYFSLWNAVPRSVKLIFGSALIAGVLLVAFTWALIATEFHSKGEPDLDYIIVLGAQVKSNTPSAVLKYRLDAAYRYLLKNPDTKCITSGGKGKNEAQSEGAFMKNYLVEMGISSDRIIAETTSKNTHENISNSMQFFSPASDTIGIVTNNFHVYRGVFLAKRHGIKHVSGITAKSTGFYLPNNMLWESAGLIKDFIMSRK